MSDANTEPGARLRELRKRRGMTQEELAELAGLSLPVIKKIEQGGTARMETYRQIAQVLGVTTVWFVSAGSPSPTHETGDELVLTEMRAAVTPPIGLNGMPILGTADHDDIALPRLHAAATAMGRAYHVERYDDLAHLLPALVQSAHYHVAQFNDGAEQVQARQIRSAILGVAGRYLIQIRAHDLAMVTLQKAVRDALAANDMSLAASAISSQAWAMLRQGRFDEVERLCAEAANEIEPRMSQATADELSAWGWLLMRASAGAIRNNRPEEANEYLTLAETAGTRIGHEHDLAGQQSFGPITVALLRPENAMIEGRPDKALQEMERLPASRPSKPHASTWNRAQLDKARALVKVGDSDEATRVMKELRFKHPDWLRYQQAARDVASDILHSRTRMPSADQRDLADFLDLEG